MKLIKELNLESRCMSIMNFLIGIILYIIMTRYIYYFKFIIIYIAWLVVIETPIHEFLHKYGGKIFNVECDINLKYKWRNKLWKIDINDNVPKSKYPYCRPQEGRYLTFLQLVVFSIFPILIPTSWLFLSIITGQSFLLIPAIFSFSNSIGDILYVINGWFILIRNSNKNIVFEDVGAKLKVYELL